MTYCDFNLGPLDKPYHDKEWGVPVHSDRKQFEFLSLEVMQCGLNWGLMLKKREVFRMCFDRYDFTRIADYSDADFDRILAAPGMIRSPRKIAAIISNAQSFLRIRNEFGTFSRYIWDFCGGKTILYKGHETGNIPVSNGLSSRLSEDLRARGFKFLGPVVVYSHLQACGVVNDHSERCPCYAKIVAKHPTIRKRRDAEEP